LAQSRLVSLYAQFQARRLLQGWTYSYGGNCSKILQRTQYKWISIVFVIDIH